MVTYPPSFGDLLILRGGIRDVVTTKGGVFAEHRVTVTRRRRSGWRGDVKTPASMYSRRYDLYPHGVVVPGVPILSACLIVTFLIHSIRR